MEYNTPKKKMVFPAGSGGMVNVNVLHMTPMEYIKSYRIQAACQMLAKGQETVTSISQACGLGSSSYFGKIFRECMGCSPTEYRHKWQDSNI